MALSLAPRFKDRISLESLRDWARDLIRWEDLLVKKANNLYCDAWGLITTGPTPVIRATSDNWANSYVGNNLKITLTAPIDSLVVPIAQRAATIPNFVSTTAHTNESFEISLYNSGGTQENLSASVRTLSFVVFGREVA